MKRKNIFLLLLLLLLLTACSDRSEPEPQPTPSSGRPTMPPSSSVEPTETPEPTPSPIPTFECETEVTQTVVVGGGNKKYVMSKRKLTDVDRALENGEIVPVKSGDSLFLDEDGGRDTFTLEYGGGSDAEGYPFRLSCGNCTLEGTTYCTSGEVYAAKLSGTRGRTIQLLVPKSSAVHPGTGEEEITAYMIFYYGLFGGEHLAYVTDISPGREGGIRQTIEISENGFWKETTFSFPGINMGLPCREEMVLCMDCLLGKTLEEGGCWVWDLCVIPPEGSYPIKTVRKTEAPMYVYQYGEDEPSYLLPAGSIIALGATDGHRWVYFEPFQSGASGWLRIEEQDGIAFVKGPEDTELTYSGLFGID